MKVKLCALYVGRGSHIGFAYAVKLYRSLQPRKILKFLLGEKCSFFGGVRFFFLLLYSFSLVCVVDRHGHGPRGQCEMRSRVGGLEEIS